jgi:glycosyltransferase involved in cell wall biosynthesis
VGGVIVHEWLSQAGGSERVVEQFAQMFTDADLRVLWSDIPGCFGLNAHETWLARTPLRRHKALALPFMPTTWRHQRTSTPYDWALVSTHLFAHHVRFHGAGQNPPKYLYVHTPARYIWAPEHDERGKNPVVRAAGAFFKPLDRRRAQEAVSICANSQFTRRRIQECWGLDAEVIYPPVRVAEIQADLHPEERLSERERAVYDRLPSDFILGASRFIPYKRLDRVIDLAEAADIPAVIAGQGPLESALRQRGAEAKVPVTIVTAPSDAMLRALYRRARVFVFPPVEDFGMMPVEAMAAGTPVIVNRLGGASESVTPGVTGEAVDMEKLSQSAGIVVQVASARPSAAVDSVFSFDEDLFRQRVLSWMRLAGGSDVEVACVRHRGVQ